MRDTEEGEGCLAIEWETPSMISTLPSPTFAKLQIKSTRLMATAQYWVSFGGEIICSNLQRKYFDKLEVGMDVIMNSVRRKFYSPNTSSLQN